MFTADPPRRDRLPEQGGQGKTARGKAGKQGRIEQADTAVGQAWFTFDTDPGPAQNEIPMGMLGRIVHQYQMG